MNRQQYDSIRRAIFVAGVNHRLSSVGMNHPGYNEMSSRRANEAHYEHVDRLRAQITPKVDKYAELKNIRWKNIQRRLRENAKKVARRRAVQQLHSWPRWGELSGRMRAGAEIAVSFQGLPVEQVLAELEQVVAGWPKAGAA